MHFLYYLSLALFIALIVNDHILARRVRKAIELGQLSGDASQAFRAGGSPVGILVNLLRFGSIPSSNPFFSTQNLPIYRLLRLQKVLGALFLGSVAAALVRGVAI